MTREELYRRDPSKFLFLTREELEDLLLDAAVFLHHISDTDPNPDTNEAAAHKLASRLFKARNGLIASRASRA